MKSALLILLATFCFSALSISQDLDLQWSETKVYSKKIDGFHKYFIGTTDNFIYSYSGPYLKAKKTSIICYDKVSMEQINKLELFGSESASRKRELEDKSYLRTIVIDNVLHVFWQTRTGKKIKNSTRELFVETYDKNLKLVSGMRSIKMSNEGEVGGLTIMTSKGDKNTQKKNGIVITNGISRGKDNPFVVEVDHFDAQMQDISSEEYTLSVAPVSNNTYTFYGNFNYEQDGNLYLNADLTEATKTGLFKRSFKYYSQITVINVRESSMEVTEFKDENKDIYSLRVVSKPNGNYLMGFFRDLKKDETGSRTHGIFSAKINVQNGSFDQGVYTYFSKEVLDKLFQEDTDDRKKSKKLSKKKKEKEDQKNEEAISYNYVIEQTTIGPKGELILVCSTMYNYSVTTCTTNSNGSTSCHTNYYCNKKNVTVFTLDPNGEIAWSQNIDRNITYSGTSIYDIEMATKNGKYYIIYGGNNTMDLEGLSKREKKKMADKSDNFSYAVMDPVNQSLDPKTFKIEQKSDKKEDQRYVTPANIRVFDNVFYTASEVSRVKVLPTVGLCIGSIPCPPLLFLFVTSKEAFQKTTGQLGRIEPID